MSLTAGRQLLLSGTVADYQIERSLRFNSGDSAYLSRTPASASNRKTWTWAGWVKRSELGARQNIFGTADASFFNGFWAEFFSDDKIRIGDIGPSALDLELKSTQVFRDCSAWGHLLIAVDTTQATASNRVSVYWNGSKISVFDTASYPTQNFDTRLNTTAAHGIGRAGSYNAQYFNGYLADIHFIDGQALTPTSFGRLDANNVWQPKAYTGSYGTNGFQLKFADNSAATAAALGKDTSGNGHNWTPTNLSVTTGAGNDSLVDVPTNGTEVDTGVGGEVRGNYATLNPLDNGGVFLGNGNLEVAGKSFGFYGFRSTIGQSTGKWYFECTVAVKTDETRTGPGLYRSTDVLGNTYGDGTVVIYDSAGVIYVRNESGSGSTWYSTPGAIFSGDILGFAFDLDAQKVWIHRNGTWLNSGNPGAGTGAVVSSLPTGTYFPGGWAYSISDRLVFNFGQRAFAYNSNRSGFKALCTANLTSTTITTNGSYTGNGVADGPFVYLNGVPTAMTVNGNAVTFGTHADKLSNGFKIRTTSTTYNQNASMYNYSITSIGDPFKTARAQANP